MHTLELKKISKSFGGVDAVRNVNLVINRGESRALIGPNGAGKTTLFNLVTGEIRVDAGQIILFDRDLTQQPVQKRIGLGLGRTYQISNLFMELTVRENLSLASWKKTREKSPSLFSTLFRPWDSFRNQWGHAESVAQRIGLEDKLDVPVSQLSHGEQRQLELGMTLAHEPKILLLDEPMAGLSANERAFISQLIIELKPEITIVVIEHDIDVAFNIADQVSVLEHGSIIAEGTPNEIQSNSQVQELYTLKKNNTST